ncbi:pilus assembly protein CpaF [Arcanobacterium wilhelmae]|uniref:Pilus assembly protein CpaF n=1 Tax=Arcanobacterium wilhelmae TaxID=1803177 RepID=A0ABT9NCQ5_9ACTO|nr:ATPase, T2SS/T4P/T4SS family [Arcanobacterium wilhelmae]MDP9801491.1 pilus assembly protein CpaF [Arcanobacterium wilhelmae]WFN90822.1 ATPase, T2SS/T4P/T4SS family [Arcanobacterium wilhelmae]
MGAIQWLDRRVREMVREQRVDPMRRPEQLEELIESAVAEYEGLTIAGAVEPIGDDAGVRRVLRDEIGGFGQIQPLIDDPEIEEIWLNSPGKVFYSKGGSTTLSSIVLRSDQVRQLVERMLLASGRRLDLSSPFVDAALHSGERLHVVIPDITREHWSVNIRKYVVQARSLEMLVERGMLTGEAARFLALAMDSGLNVVVSGATQAGKTTMLRALLGEVRADERIVSAEEVFELNLDHRDVVAMQTRPANIEGRGEVTLRRLVKEALRMRPERIVIGEVRQAEAFDMLIALNSGIPGACTVHANSAREAVNKLCVLPLLAGENVSTDFVVPTVASSIDVVVHVRRDRSGNRQVTEIVGLTGRVEGSTVEISELFVDRGGGLVRGLGEIPKPELFERAGHDMGGVRWGSPLGV